MNWLLLCFALEVGWLPQGDFLMHEPTEVVSVGGMYYVDFDARVTMLDHFFVGGEVSTIMWKQAAGIGFSPERMLYQINAGVQLNCLELGWRHYCTHPMWPYLTAWRGTSRWEGGYEEVYLKLEGEFGIERRK